MSEALTKKVSVATVWLDGCSGCHMSLFDMDERLADLAASIDIVYGPLVDAKLFPEQVDMTLVEGSVSSEVEDAARSARDYPAYTEVVQRRIVALSRRDRQLRKLSIVIPGIGQRREYAGAL